MPKGKVISLLIAIILQWWWQQRLCSMDVIVARAETLTCECVFGVCVSVCLQALTYLSAGSVQQVCQVVDRCDTYADSIDVSLCGPRVIKFWLIAAMSHVCVLTCCGEKGATTVLIKATKAYPWAHWNWSTVCECNFDVQPSFLTLFSTV